MKKLVLTVSLVGLLAHGAFAKDVHVTVVHMQQNPGELKLMGEMARTYEASHPGVKIDIRKFGDDYKTTLATSLQSNDPPSIIYSWGGGVLTDQVKAGLLRPVDGKISAETKAAAGAVGVDAFTRDGKLYGIAQNVSQVVFWYNKDLFKKAGVDPASMANWDGFLAGVGKLKEAGITPLAMGSKDKWPAAFFWDYLAIRLAGRSGMEAARDGQNGGFAALEFVKAGEEFLRLSKLAPYQKGFEAAGYPSASGTFGDGKAAMILMGDWNYQESKTNSSSGKGLSDEQLGFFTFPAVAGQKGTEHDTLGGINGWIFSKAAPDEAIDFMAWYQKPENISQFAKAGYYIPINPKAADSLANPFLKQIAQNISASPYHAIFFDQSLGLSAGGAVNDVSAALTSQAISAKQAAQDVEDAMALDR